MSNDLQEWVTDRNAEVVRGALRRLERLRRLDADPEDEGNGIDYVPTFAKPLRQGEGVPR